MLQAGVRIYVNALPVLPAFATSGNIPSLRSMLVINFTDTKRLLLLIPIPDSDRPIV